MFDMVPNAPLNRVQKLQKQRKINVLSSETVGHMCFGKWLVEKNDICNGVLFQ